MQSFRELLILSHYMKQLLQGFWSLLQYLASQVPLYLNLSLDAIGAGQTTIVYKIPLSKYFCSAENLETAFVVSDVQVPCQQQNCCGSPQNPHNIHSFTEHSASDFLMGIYKKKKVRKNNILHELFTCKKVSKWFFVS